MNKKNKTELLGKEKICETAIQLIHQEGLNKLSMRSIAQTLQVSATALYWHFKDKDELLEYLSDVIVSRIPYPNKINSWDRQLLELGLNYRQVLLTIRDSTQIMLNTPPFTPYRLKLIESLYQLLLTAGFESERVPTLAGMFHNYVLAYVADEMNYMQKNEERGMEPDNAVQETIHKFESSPVEEFPAIVKLAKESAQIHSDNFEYGLMVLLSGFKQSL
ncbi:TetR/AcrR family transcriptional regulator C-terminal domain-containing protein [Paenibacillus sp. P26]|nr:TetR/AcrR family transcriptional regulator C-terminal domain-containing protein [Paenibacillus sp. P26]UUZ92879.1 TetR/AcrR family transcriptional regulator C-terminal domain-containing protein [Paenibacillus sp. P25]